MIPGNPSSLLIFPHLHFHEGLTGSDKPVVSLRALSSWQRLVFCSYTKFPAVVGLKGIASTL